MDTMCIFCEENETVTKLSSYSVNNIVTKLCSFVHKDFLFPRYTIET